MWKRALRRVRAKPRAMARRPLLHDRSDALVLIGLAAAAFAVRLIPVLRGGGLGGLQGYDDGVYFGAAMAAVAGVLPYRDFLLLNPPEIVLLLSPFAILGQQIGDPAAFALARVAFMMLGALNAVLVALTAGRYGRTAGLTAGVLYAVWNTAANGERTTDLHAPENTLLLLGLLALSRPGRIRQQRAALVGVALGLATAVQLWQVVSLVVIVWWVVVRSPRRGRAKLSAAAFCVAGAAVAFAAICVPFFAVAPEAAVRYVFIDQVNRPSMQIDVLERLRVLEGLPQLSRLPAAVHAVVMERLVVILAAIGLALVIGTAVGRPWTRPWAALAIVQTIVLLSTPSFFDDYPSFVAPAATLVIGTGLAELTILLGRRGWRPMLRISWGVALAILAIGSMGRKEGAPLPVSEIERDVASARCVVADSPALLILTSTLRRDLDARCAIVFDPTGTSYDTDRGRLRPGPGGASRRQAPGYQAAMTEWYTSGDAALFVRPKSNGLSTTTQAAIERRLPVELRRGAVIVRVAAR
jgi:alpha-1,2-mannosyltransferase